MVMLDLYISGFNVSTKLLLSLIFIIILSLSNNILICKAINMQLNNAEVYEGTYPFGLEYVFLDYYYVNRDTGLVLFTIQPEIIEYNHYGRLYIMNLFNNTRRSMSFLDFNPIHAYIFGKYVLVVGVSYKKPKEYYPLIGTGYGVYLLDQYNLEIQDHTILEEGNVTAIFPYTDITPISKNELLLPISGISINGEAHSIIYRIKISNKKIASYDKVFDIKIHQYFYPYLKPITYKDLLLWGPYIISLENYTVLRKYMGMANTSYLSYISNGIYYFDRNYMYPGYSAMEIIGVNLTSLDIVRRIIIYNYTIQHLEIHKTYIVNNRYIVIIATPIRGRLGFLLSDKILVMIYDLRRSSLSILFDRYVNGFLIGIYDDYTLLMVNSSKLYIVDPVYGIIYNMTIHGLQMEYASPGSLILLYNPSNRHYYMLLLPIMYNKYFIVVFSEKELMVLNEPPLAPILLLISLMIYLYKKLRVIL